MRLIAILLSLWANRYPERIDRWRRPESFYRYTGWVDARFRALRLDDGLSRYLAMLLPPVLLMAVLQWLAHGWLLGLGELVLSLAALLFAHGSGQVDSHLEAFSEAWRQRRPEYARQALAELDEAAQPTDDAALPAAAVDALFWQSYRRVFSAIFWLLLLGPVGPVLMRIAALVHDYAERRAEPALAQVASAFLFTLDWLPVRATALAFGLAGSFVHAVEGWRAALQTPDEHSRRIVAGSGRAALDADETEMQPDSAVELLADARALVSRSLLVWLAATALMTIAGWLY